MVVVAGGDVGVERGGGSRDPAKEASAGRRCSGLAGGGVWRSEADGSERATGLGEGAQGGGHVREAGQTAEGDGEVVQAGHDRWTVADTDTRAVLAEGHVADIMGAVLDAPVAAVELQQAVRVSLLRRQTGHEEDGLVALLTGFELGDFAFDATDLGDIGEVDIIVEGGGGQQAALLQAPVALIDGLGAEGENALRSGR